MNGRAVYLCFSSWVESRQWGRDNGVAERDLILAHSPTAMHSVDRVDGPIIFLRTQHEPQTDRDLERWRALASHARELNEARGYETEILNR